MKTNSLLTLSSQKMPFLFLLEFMRINRVESGQAFNSCLISNNNDTVSYGKLINFPFLGALNSSNELLNICCENQCFSSQFISPCQKRFWCNIINQLVFCSDWKQCSGIIGDSPILSNVTLEQPKGNCSSNFSEVGSYLSTISSTNFVGLSQGYSHLSCSENSPCSGLGCNWDNGGWTCWGNITIHEDYNWTGCFLQWTSPFPVSFNISPIVPTNSSNNNSASITASNSISNSSIIGLGVGLGAGLPLLVGISTIFFKFYKNRFKVIG